MPSRTEAKAATRELVLKTAGRSLRRNGIAGTGVAAVMAEAGLTHGGFYAHFKSKEAMTAAAIASSFDETYVRISYRFDQLPPAEALAAWIEMYLSPRHRDDPERGCSLPTLGAEVARGDEASRAALAAGFSALSGRVERWLGGMGRTDAATLSTAMLTEAIGAMTFARVLGATLDSDILLDNARASLRARAGLAS